MSVVALPRTRWPRRARLRLIARRLVPRQVPFLLGATLAVSALVLGIVSLQAVLSETSFEMRELNRKAAQLQADHSRLRLTVAELSSPERIAREARKLGLHIPSDVRTLSVSLPPGFERSRSAWSVPRPLPDGESAEGP